jgi:hypothetical protein
LRAILSRGRAIAKNTALQRNDNTRCAIDARLFINAAQLLRGIGWMMKCLAGNVRCASSSSSNLSEHCEDEDEAKT